MAKKNLTKEQVRHLAQLAGLSLNSAEEVKYEKQLSETLSYIENLSALDTSKTQPTDHVTDQKDVFFQDGEVNNRSLSKKEVFANTKKRKENYFKVKRIL